MTEGQKSRFNKFSARQSLIGKNECESLPTVILPTDFLPVLEEKGSMDLHALCEL